MTTPAPISNWTLRPAKPEDEAFLEALYCRIHALDFAGVALPEEQVRGLVQMQARAQRLGYLREFPEARSSIVSSGARPVGRVLVDYPSDAVHLIDIALLPENQGQGIGTKLLKDLQAEAQERSVPLRLSVLPQNPALQLYSRLGFQIVSVGLQLNMEWQAKSEGELSETTGSQDDTAQQAFTSVNTPADPAAQYQALTGRDFRPEGAGFEVTLDHVQRHPAYGFGSFSLFFLGPLEPVLAQGTHSLSLKGKNGESEQEFAIFLGPLGPVGDRMRYQAVFNL